MARLLDAVPPGSYLAISHVASDIEPEDMAEMAERLNRIMSQKGTFRTRPEVERLFRAWSWCPPGVVRIQEWRPAAELEAKRPAAMWGGVGRKGSGDGR